LRGLPLWCSILVLDHPDDIALPQQAQGGGGMNNYNPAIILEFTRLHREGVSVAYVN